MDELLLHTHQTNREEPVEHYHVNGYQHAHWHKDGDIAKPVFFCGCPIFPGRPFPTYDVCRSQKENA